MKRIGLFLLAVVMVAGLVGCSNDDDDFSFVGVWTLDERIVASQCSWHNASWRIEIANDSGDPNAVTIRDMADNSTFHPTNAAFDSGSGRMSLSWSNRSGGTSIIEGQRDGDDIMKGTGYYDSGNSCWLRTTWAAARM